MRVGQNSIRDIDKAVKYMGNIKIIILAGSRTKNEKRDPWDL